jgi:hypothetical protein
LLNRHPLASIRGFLRLYNLDFAGGQKEFETWEKINPEDAMGPVSEAAGILFSEFNRLGVLEAQFYEDDSVFAARKKYEADPQQRARFEQQLNRAEDLAKARLTRNPRDLSYRKAQLGFAPLHERGDRLVRESPRRRSQLLRRSSRQRR